MADRFLHTVAVQEQAIAADGVYTYDLAVNPLSVVLLCIRPLNDTGTLANVPTLKMLAQAMNRVSIIHRGESIISMRGEDALAMAIHRHGIEPYQGQLDNVDNERRCGVIPLLMGRHAYHPKSCFPATRRGELVLEVDLDIADTGYDGLRFSVETVELLDAKPSEYEKKVQITQTWSATGDQDFDLPPGNVCRGLLLFGTTPFGGAAPAPSWGRIKVLLDNQETHYGATDFEVAQMLRNLWGRYNPMADHKHTLDATVAGVTETTATFDNDENWNQYVFMDFDPTQDDTYSLDTGRKTRFHVRANAETADAVRVVPVEVIKV